MESTLTPDQWALVWRLYDAVADLPEHEREPVLRASAHDPGVILQVRTLLESTAGNIPAEPVSRTGARISHYSVGERIGRGGMGDVYAALDLELDRNLAIKFLPERMLGDERAVRRFLAEAKAASALNHPNLVTVHEFVREEGLLAIVMERIEGETLRRLLPGTNAGGAAWKESLRRLTRHPAEDSSPIWSPDGRTIAFARHTGPLARNAIYLVSAEGGPEREIGVTHGAMFGDWSPDSR